MRTRTVRLTLGAMLIATAVVAGVAWAGGWAVATLHPVETAPVAGRQTTIGFSLRQHGRTSVRIPDTAVEIVAPDGATTRFPGRPLARTGRYAATVTFPSAGTWRWRVIKGWFGPQELGTVTVTTGAAGAGRGVDGRALFLAKGCGVCHFGPDSSAQVDVGPSLRDLADRFPRKAGLEYIRQSIRKPNAVIAGGGQGTFSTMPLLEVTAAEADAIARYLLTRRK